MKNKILTAISTIMLFIPWTILPLRTFDWALESPVAEIMVYQLRRLYDFFRYLFHSQLYQRKVKSKGFYVRAGRVSRKYLDSKVYDLCDKTA